MKKLFIFILFSVFGTIANAQDYKWAKNVGSAGGDFGYSTTNDSLGNCYVTGSFSGTVDFDPGAGVANHTAVDLDDIFFAKYDSNGNYIWAKSIGGNYYDDGNSIYVDIAGNCYITGFFDGTADFDPGVGTAMHTSSGWWDIFFAKYDSNGNYLWAKSIGDSGEDFATSIAVDGSGNCYITGAFTETVDFDPSAGTALLTTAYGEDIFFAKYDASGNYLWAKNIGSSYDEDRGNSIALDASGNCYITGWFTDVADFDPGVGISNLTTSGLFDIFFAKYDSNGNYLWAKRIGSTGEDRGWSLALDGIGNCYISGFFRGSVDFDPGTGLAYNSSAGSDDVFFAKYDSNGNYVWAKRIGSGNGDYCYSIKVDDSGNSFITGCFSNTADFNPGSGLANLSSAGGLDIFFAKYNQNGNYIWAKKIGGTGDDRGYSISLDDTYNCYIAGFFQSSPDFDPGVGISNLTSIGGYDIFFAKYTQMQPPVASFVASDSIICFNTCINYSDFSSGPPDTWNWTFAGATPASSNLQNPMNICYASPGTYTATLIITNPIGSDTVSQNIYVSSSLPTVTAFAVSDTICNGFCTNITANGALTYSWMPGSLSGATVNVCPTTNTIYTVTGIGANGCSNTDTIDVFVDSCLSVNNYDNNFKFIVFPNPATSIITIQTPVKTTIEILNIEGQTIKTIYYIDLQTTINVSDLSSGIYIIKAKTDKGVAVKKFIKE